MTKTWDKIVNDMMQAPAIPGHTTAIVTVPVLVEVKDGKIGNIVWPAREDVQALLAEVTSLGKEEA